MNLINFKATGRSRPSVAFAALITSCASTLQKAALCRMYALAAKN